MLAFAFFMLLFAAPHTPQQTSTTVPTGDAPPYLLTRPAPNTSDCGKAADMVALTILSLTVDTKGDPHAVHVQTSSGDKCLDRAAVAVAKNYKFRPAVLKGRPIDMDVAVNVPFDPPAPSNSQPNADAIGQLGGGTPCNAQPGHGAPVIRVMLDVHGQISSVALFQTSGDPCTDQLALKAASQYHFNPVFRNGAPAPAELHIAVKLDKVADAQSPPPA